LGQGTTFRFLNMFRKHLAYLCLLSLILLLGSCAMLKDKAPAKRKKSPSFDHEILKDENKRANHDDADESSSNRSDREFETASTALEDFIEDWYGTPHRMGGMTKSGVDCSGFVIIAYREVFGRNFKGRRAEDLFSEMKALIRSDLEYGDLVFFKVRGHRIDHVGIYLKNGDFAHTSSSRGVMISNLSNVYWNKRFFKGARFKS
ncbi:MAG: C40 family peptidase, partial [Croceimicrobium sp.]